MSEKKYICIETGEVFTESEIRNQYEQFKRETKENYYPATFEEYMNDALSKNGSLEEVADEVWIKKLQRDVASDIACDEMPYNDVLNVLQKWNAFGNWTIYEINNRPVDIDALSEDVAKELGVWR